MASVYPGQVDGALSLETADRFGSREGHGAGRVGAEA